MCRMWSSDFFVTKLCLWLFKDGSQLAVANMVKGMNHSKGPQYQKVPQTFLGFIFKKVKVIEQDKYGKLFQHLLFSTS